MLGIDMGFLPTTIEEKQKLTTEELLQGRYDKFRKIGA